MSTIKKANRWLMNTYSPFPIVIMYGEGSTVFDDKCNRYIDFTSGIGVSSLGYGNEKLIEAIENQVTKITHISNLFYTQQASDLAEKVCKMSKMEKVFFSNSGAEANEAAIKIARKYSYDKYGKNRHTMITLTQSFHGRTITTLAATGQEHFHQSFFPFTEGFQYVKANDIDDLRAKVDDTICGIMMESIQGEGGVYPLSEEFVNEVVCLSKEKDIAIIFDEVQCGIGRTGKFLGYEHYNIEPDIVTLAKGLGGGVPIGAVLSNQKMSNVLTVGDHGSTYGGNPLVCAAANEVLEQVGQYGFLDNVAKKGEYIKDVISSWNLPNIIEIRGKGLMIGIEIKGSVKTIQQEALNQGLLLLSAGGNTIRILPPLTINKAEIDEGLAILKQVLMEG